VRLGATGAVYAVRERRTSAVRFRHAARVARDTFCLTPNLTDPDRDALEVGNCVVRLELGDAPGHEAIARGPLGATLELYRLSPGRRPDAADSRSSGTWARPSTPT
jgi:hypothetical protein